jgi:hypothetical protein
MPLEKLTRARIVHALNLLGELAEKEGVTLELCIYGGSAMMLAYGARDGTKDVDATVQPGEVGARLAQQIAEQLGLDESWLNDDIRKFLSDRGTFAPLEIQELESSAKQHLKITRASAGYLLAMKCLACRPDLPGWQRDVGDIRFLVRKMGITTLAEVEQHVNRFYPYEGLHDRARAVIEEILGEQQREQR